MRGGDRVFVDDLVAAHAEEVEQERSDHPGPVLAGGAVEDHTLGAGLRHRVHRLCQPMSEMGDHEFVDPAQDRKSTRLNSSHVAISYADFCLKKKNCTTLSRRYENIH